MAVLQNLVSKVFAGLGVVFGLSTLVAIGLGNPIAGIPLAILSLGSEYASVIHN